MKVSANRFFPLIRNLVGDSAKNTDGDYKQDTYKDAEILLCFQDALFALSLISPYIFSKYVDYEIEDENVLQRLPENMLEIIDIHAVDGVRGLKESGKTDMDLGTPNWINSTPASPRQWMRDKRSKDMFFLYPTPKKGTVLTMQCVYVPLLESINEEFDFNIQYQPVLVQKTISMLLAAVSEPQGNTSGVSMFDLMANKAFGADDAAETKKLEDKN